MSKARTTGRTGRSSRSTRSRAGACVTADRRANPIDAFVARAARTGGAHARAAGVAEILIRRLALDLTGLPPTPAEIDAFLADDRPARTSALVDR